MKTLLAIGVNTLYLLALINPISKIAVLAGMTASEDRRHLGAIVRKSSLTAGCILLGAMFFGDFILRQVFHVELQALRVSGGVVLFWVGFNALRKGVFFEQDTHGQAVADLAIVPLACPMIAGPASIAAAIALTAREGVLVPACAVVIGILVNAALMRYSRPIARVLQRLDILSALIRITGLIVMTIGAQMVLDGLAEWRKLAGM
jgi:multiple antibiotic resistance protein